MLAYNCFQISIDFRTTNKETKTNNEKKMKKSVCGSAIFQNPVMGQNITFQAIIGLLINNNFACTEEYLVSLVSLFIAFFELRVQIHNADWDALLSLFLILFLSFIHDGSGMKVVMDNGYNFSSSTREELCFINLSTLVLLWFKSLLNLSSYLVFTFFMTALGKADWFWKLGTFVRYILNLFLFLVLVYLPSTLDKCILTG